MQRRRSLVSSQRLLGLARLKHDEQARTSLASLYRDTGLGGPEPHVEVAARGVGAPEPYDPLSFGPPTPCQVRPLIEAAGAAETLEILARCHGAAPEAPIYDQQFAYALLHELVTRGNEEDAAALAPYFQELHPELASTFTWWVGRSRGQVRYHDFCVAALKAARLLQPGDTALEKQLAELEAGLARR